jgi:hypothetical protein
MTDIAGEVDAKTTASAKMNENHERNVGPDAGKIG